jgi:hypothetical protein
MPDDKYPCAICGKPGDVMWASVGAFSSGYALCRGCREHDQSLGMAVRRANAEARAFDDFMKRETESHP